MGTMNDPQASSSSSRKLKLLNAAAAAIDAVFDDSASASEVNAVRLIARCVRSDPDVLDPAVEQQLRRSGL